jgi:hypothetical protein
MSWLNGYVISTTVKSSNYILPYSVRAESTEAGWLCPHTVIWYTLA